MNRVDYLLEKLAPSGVERISLGSVITNLRTGLNPRQNFVLNSPGSMNHYVTVRELGGFKLRITDKTDKVDDEALALIQRRAQIVVGDVLFSGTGTIGNTALVEDPPLDWSVKEGVYIITPDSKSLNSKFLIYLLMSTSIRRQMLNKAEGSTVASLSMASLREISILLPPMDVQHEIVRILDTFTELGAELEAELEARKKQFEHYRNELLKSTEAENPGIQLAAVASIFDGTHQTPDYVQEGIRFVSVENIKNLKGSEKFIAKSVFEKLYKNKPARGDVIMTRIGSVGDCALVDFDEPIAFYVSLALIKPDPKKVDSAYLKFYLESYRGRAELYKRTLHQAVPLKINLGDIGKISVILPPLEVQKEIVSRLISFQEITESVGTGLPGEIRARREQHEHYRDKLLSFKELSK